MKIDNIVLLFVYCLSVVCFCIAALISYSTYWANDREISRVTKKYESDEEINDKHNIQHFNKLRDSYRVHKLREIKKLIDQVNDRHHIISYGNSSGLRLNYTTILVIRVYPDLTQLGIFFESLRHIIGINKSLLIFAHILYNEDIIKLIASLQFASVMQIFYPYSVQLHPNIYPDQDSRFCQEFSECVYSRKRSPILSQKKLFWWWVTNQVFDHIGVLKSYKGYIYFLESRLYLTNDFIYMARVMEKLRVKYCSECRFLSLGARAPQPDRYIPMNSAFVIGVWGWSKYSNSVFGFNRTTWNEIRALKEHFCHFEDASWENSLKHLALNTRENNFFMLFIEAPRFFPTFGCGAFRKGTGCNLSTIYQDIYDFVPTIKYNLTAHRFAIKFDSSVTSNEVRAEGRWGDARDRALCMFFSSAASRMYY